MKGKIEGKKVYKRNQYGNQTIKSKKTKLEA
jgi:hypothetical protein